MLSFLVALMCLHYPETFLQILFFQTYNKAFCISFKRVARPHPSSVLLSGIINEFGNDNPPGLMLKTMKMTGLVTIGIKDNTSV